MPSAERLKKLEVILQHAYDYNVFVHNRCAQTLLRDSGGAGLLDELQMREAGAEAHLCPLREALWASAQAFHAVGSKVHSRGDSKRLWLFTNDDHPNEHDTGEQVRRSVAAALQ